MRIGESAIGILRRVREGRRQTRTNEHGRTSNRLDSWFATIQVTGSQTTNTSAERDRQATYSDARRGYSGTEQFRVLFSAGDGKKERRKTPFLYRL